MIHVYCFIRTNQNKAVEGQMRPVCHPHGHGFDSFDFREI